MNYYSLIEKIKNTNPTLKYQLFNNLQITYYIYFERFHPSGFISFNFHFSLTNFIILLITFKII
jgi:hypothetical protein